MPQSNQPAYVQINFPAAAFTSVYTLTLLTILQKADCIHVNDIKREIIIRPPKGIVNNHEWAVKVADYCCKQGIPALVYRPQDTASAIR